MADNNPTPSTEEIAARLNAMDKAIVLLQGVMDRMPTPAIVDEHVSALKELTFTQIISLKELVDAKFDGNKTALDAALKTQKEASDKLESNFTKQMDTIGERVGELRDSIKAAEGKVTGTTASTGFMFTLFGALIGFAGIAMAIVAYLTKVQ